MAKIKKTKTVEYEIDVQFPYYFKSDVSDENYVSEKYGKILENGKEIVVEYWECNTVEKYSISIDISDYSYITFEPNDLDNLSNEEEFESKIKEAIEFINKNK